MRPYMRVVAVVALAGSAVMSAGSAQAVDSNADYGQHVRMCAQDMGFDGSHNPGVHHQGKSGWEPGHTCTMG